MVLTSNELKITGDEFLCETYCILDYRKWILHKPSVTTANTKSFFKKNESPFLIVGTHYRMVNENIYKVQNIFDYISILHLFTELHPL